MVIGKVFYLRTILRPKVLCTLHVVLMMQSVRYCSEFKIVGKG